MSVSDFKSANVIFPGEDSIRTIFFASSDVSAADVLSSLIMDKGVEVNTVHGFSAEKISFVSSSVGEQISAMTRH